MEKIDPKFTEKMQAWLSGEHASKEAILEGAELLLQLNGNKVLYNNIQRNPERPMWKEKLEYELKKHLQIRLDNLTRQEVAVMDNRVMEEAAVILSGKEDGKSALIAVEAGNVSEEMTKGRRADHASLPAEIQQLFEGNRSRYQKIRALHTQLRAMSNKKSCDRYEFLKQLDELDKDYRLNMQKYDEYKADEKTTTVENGGSEGDNKADSGRTPEEMKKAVDVARTWVNRNTPKLTALYAEYQKEDGKLTDKQAYEDLKAEFELRLGTIIDNGGKIGDKVRAKLEPLGIEIPEAVAGTGNSQDDDNEAAGTDEKTEENEGTK